MLNDGLFEAEVMLELALRLGGAAVLIVAGILISSPVCRRIIHMSLRVLGHGADPEADTVSHIAKPLRLSVLALFAYGVGAVFGLTGFPADLGDRILRTLILISLFWTALRLLNANAHIFDPVKENLGNAMFNWLIKIIDAFLIIIAVAMILEAWGAKIAAIIAGLGIFGVAVALGAQDLFKNLIAGASILVEKRFGPGDWIKVDGVVEGVVNETNFRSTLIQRFDKAPTFVPNSALSDAPLTNFSRMTHRRIKWMIGVEYGSDVAQLVGIRDAIEDYILNNDEFTGPPDTPLFVRVDKFGPSSIDILVYCFTRTTDWGRWLEIKETLAMTIKNIVADAGTGFAFPSRTLYIHSLDEQDQDVGDVLSADPLVPGASEPTVLILAKENPKQPGSKAAAMFDLYEQGLTRAQLRVRGIATADIRYNLKKGYIAFTD